MADLAKLFKRAEKELTNTGLKQSCTMETLKSRVPEQGIAWRWKDHPKKLQIYPTYKKSSSKSSTDGDYFVVVKDSNPEYRYYDPDHKLVLYQWNYVGCPDCSNLSEDIVFCWIKQAYEYLMRDKGIKHK